MKRIGIFGGSFDPIHMGHLILAEQCREQLRLDEVRFVPASISPLKQHAAPIASKHRIEMIRLAIAGNPCFTMDQREIDREGVSYTVDTLRSIKEENPSDELYLLMGADSVKDLPRWKNPEEIFALANIGAILRGGFGPPDWNILRQYVSPERWKAFQVHIDTPAIEISSSDLRLRVGRQQTIRYFVPDAVEQYIHQHQLYRSQD